MVYVIYVFTLDGFERFDDLMIGLLFARVWDIWSWEYKRRVKMILLVYTLYLFDEESIHYLHCHCHFQKEPLSKLSEP